LNIGFVLKTLFPMVVVLLLQAAAALHFSWRLVKGKTK